MIGHTPTQGCKIIPTGQVIISATYLQKCHIAQGYQSFALLQFGSGFHRGFAMFGPSLFIHRINPKTLFILEIDPDFNGARKFRKAGAFLFD
jgi:hypothetical protein